MNKKEEGRKRKTWWFAECCFTSRDTVGLLGTGAQDGHLDFYTAPELCEELVSKHGA